MAGSHDGETVHPNDHGDFRAEHERWLALHDRKHEATDLRLERLDKAVFGFADTDGELHIGVLETAAKSTQELIKIRKHFESLGETAKKSLVAIGWWGLRGLGVIVVGELVRILHTFGVFAHVPFLSGLGG